tara:strand:+ start:370 stop:612 length:243 start_codon:yes stop_codon:yes gene_type:complete
MNDNKLIAEFMDYDNVGEMFPFDGDLHYHSSWNWLIPVVDKCFQKEGKHYLINDALLTINIDEVHEAVVKFIKEYNKIKN